MVQHINQVLRLKSQENPLPVSASTQEPTMPLLARFLATLKTPNRTGDYMATAPSQKSNAYSPAAGYPESTP